MRWAVPVTVNTQAKLDGHLVTKERTPEGYRRLFNSETLYLGEAENPLSKTWDEQKRKSYKAEHQLNCSGGPRPTTKPHQQVEEAKPLLTGQGTKYSSLP